MNNFTENEKKWLDRLGVDIEEAKKWKRNEGKIIFNDADFILELVNQGVNIKFSDIGSPLRSDKEFVLKLAEKGIETNLSDTYVKSYKENILDLMDEGKTINFSELGEKLKSDEQVLTKVKEVLIKQLNLAKNKSDFENLEKQYGEIPEFKKIIEEEYDKRFWAAKLNEQERLAEYINNPERTKKIGNEWVRILRVIEQKPEVYIYASNRLKKNEEFRKEAMKLGVSKELIESEDIRMQEEAKKAEVERNERKEERKKELEGVNNLKLERLKHEYEIQGEKHPNIILVNRFLEAKLSQVQYCKENYINIVDFKRILDEVSMVYPELGKQIEAQNSHASAKYLGTVEKISKTLLSGEVDIIDFAHKYKGNIKVSDLIRTSSGEERKKLQLMIIEAIASGQLGMKDYYRLFSREYDYKTIVESTNAFVRQARAENEDIQGRNNPILLASKKIYELKKYEMPYNAKSFLGTKRGFKKAGSEEIELQETTEKHVEYAKKLLNIRDEYICHHTMDKAIADIMKGDVPFEQIDKLEQENRFLENTKRLAEIDKQLELAMQENNKVEVERLQTERNSRVKAMQEELNR